MTFSFLQRPLKSAPDTSASFRIKNRRSPWSRDTGLQRKRSVENRTGFPEGSSKRQEGRRGQEGDAVSLPGARMVTVSLTPGPPSTEGEVIGLDGYPLPSCRTQRRMSRILHSLGATQAGSKRGKWGVQIQFPCYLTRHPVPGAQGFNRPAFLRPEPEVTPGAALILFQKSSPAPSLCNRRSELLEVP